MAKRSRIGDMVLGGSVVVGGLAAVAATTGLFAGSRKTQPLSKVLESILDVIETAKAGTQSGDAGDQDKLYTMRQALDTIQNMAKEARSNVAGNDIHDMIAIIGAKEDDAVSPDVELVRSIAKKAKSNVVVEEDINDVIAKIVKEDDAVPQEVDNSLDTTCLSPFIKFYEVYGGAADRHIDDQNMLYQTVVNYPDKNGLETYEMPKYFQEMPIVGDGDCGFNAVAHCSGIDNQKRHNNMRYLLINSWCNHPSQLISGTRADDIMYSMLKTIVPGLWQMQDQIKTRRIAPLISRYGDIFKAQGTAGWDKAMQPIRTWAKNNFQSRFGKRPYGVEKYPDDTCMFWMAKYTGKAIFVYGRHKDECALKAIYPCIRYKSDIPEIDWRFGTESSADTTPLCIVHGTCGSTEKRRMVWNIGGDMQWYSSGDDGAHYNYLVPLGKEAYDDAKANYNNNYVVFQAVSLEKTRNKV